MSSEYDLVAKIIIIGDSNIGKTALMYQFCESEFITSYATTIGVDMKSRVISLANGEKNGEKNSKLVKFHIWDTAGQERFMSITRSYYGRAEFAIIAFDITNLLSFYNVEKWLNEAKNNCKKYNYVLVGLKSDLDSKRKVSFELVNEYAKSNRMKYFETSSKQYYNVDEIFEHIAITLLEQKNNRNKSIKKDVFAIEQKNVPIKNIFCCFFW
jgi:Ras-related protein Rab-1A